MVPAPAAAAPALPELLRESTLDMSALTAIELDLAGEPALCPSHAQSAAAIRRLTRERDRLAADLARAAGVSLEVIRVRYGLPLSD